MLPTKLIWKSCFWVSTLIGCGFCFSQKDVKEHCLWSDRLLDHYLKTFSDRQIYWTARETGKNPWRLNGLNHWQLRQRESHFTSLALLKNPKKGLLRNHPPLIVCSLEHFLFAKTMRPKSLRPRISNYPNDYRHVDLITPDMAMDLISPTRFINDLDWVHGSRNRYIPILGRWRDAHRSKLDNRGGIFVASVSRSLNPSFSPGSSLLHRAKAMRSIDRAFAILQSKNKQLPPELLGFYLEGYCE